MYMSQVDTLNPESFNFAEYVAENQATAEVSAASARLETEQSSLAVRERGGYVTELELTSPTTGERSAILYAEPETTKPKLSASHVMMPAGPYEGTGGQHGYPRWVDYATYQHTDGPSGEQRLSVQARYADGLWLTKTYELTESSLETCTTVTNPTNTTEDTSVGEHNYFTLPDGEVRGLKINGKTLDELLGKGSEDFLLHDEDGTLTWSKFPGDAVITYPDGREIKLSASAEAYSMSSDGEQLQGDEQPTVSLWIWQRPGTNSLCFEPIVGLVGDGTRNDGVRLEPETSVTLTTRIEQR